MAVKVVLVVLPEKAPGEEPAWMAEAEHIMGYAHWVIGLVKGDVSSVNSDALRGKFLATSVKDFSGLEFFLRARFGNIRPKCRSRS